MHGGDTHTRQRLVKTFLIFNLTILFISAVYAIAFLYSKNAGIPLFDCYILKNLGIYCPGCGGSRSLVALLKLDIITSFIYYPPLVITALMIFLWDILAIISIITQNQNYIGIFKWEYFICVPVLIIVNYALRLILLFSGIDYIGDVL